MAQEPEITPSDEATTDRMFAKYAGIIFTLSFVLVCVIYYAGGYIFSSSLRAANGCTGVYGDLGYVLLMGVDRRDNDIGRSDTLMLAAVDEKKDQIALLSIPRDTRVEIENYGYDKINHAYAFGGHDLTISSVRKLLGVPVSHYILIDISAFERIVDAVGGVDIDVEKRMHYEDPWDDNGGLIIDLQPGIQHMDGAHAIQYVRYRDGEGDIGRISRQQRFIRAFFTRLISPEILPRISAILGEVKNVVQTDLSLRQLIALTKRFKHIEADGLSMAMVAGTPAYLGDVSYWIPDIVASRSLLMEGVGRELSEPMREEAERDADQYLANMPERLRRMMENSTKVNFPSSDELLAEGDRVISAHRTAEQKESKEAGTEKRQDSTDCISVLIVNSSGINGAGAEVADILQAKGFRISSVETGRSSDRPKTAVMTADSHVNLFYGMPFPCVIMPVDGAGEQQAIIYIGRDYQSARKHKDGEA